MISGYALANAKRSWYVPDFNVWGTPGWGDFQILMIENVEGTDSILFDSVSIGDGAQTVNYSELIDYKGNHLPGNLKSPRVFIKSKNEQQPFIIGSESNTSFKIGRKAELSGSVKVDLYIIEMGE